MDAGDAGDLAERWGAAKLRAQVLDDASQPDGRLVAAIASGARGGREQIQAASLDRHQGQIVRVRQFGDQPARQRACPFRNQSVHFGQQLPARLEELTSRGVWLHDQHVRASRAEMIAMRFAGRLGVQHSCTILQRSGADDRLPLARQRDAHDRPVVMVRGQRVLPAKPRVVTRNGPATTLLNRLVPYETGSADFPRTVPPIYVMAITGAATARSNFDEQIIQKG